MPNRFPAALSVIIGVLLWTSLPARAVELETITLPNGRVLQVPRQAACESFYGQNIADIQAPAPKPKGALSFKIKKTAGKSEVRIIQYSKDLSNITEAAYSQARYLNQQFPESRAEILTHIESLIRKHESRNSEYAAKDTKGNGAYEQKQIEHAVAASYYSEMAEALVDYASGNVSKTGRKSFALPIDPQNPERKYSVQIFVPEISQPKILAEYVGLKTKHLSPEDRRFLASSIRLIAEQHERMAEKLSVLRGTDLSTEGLELARRIELNLAAAAYYRQILASM